MATTAYHPQTRTAMGNMTKETATPASTVTTDWKQGLPDPALRRVYAAGASYFGCPCAAGTLDDRRSPRFISPPPTTLEVSSGSYSGRSASARPAVICVLRSFRRYDAAVGLFQVRQLHLTFETAEWGFAIASAFWGRAFLQGRRCYPDFAFDVVGVRRLEARAAVQNGRGNGALRKIGAVQEGILRKSFLRGGKLLDQGCGRSSTKTGIDRRPYGARRSTSESRGGSKTRHREAWPSPPSSCSAAPSPAFPACKSLGSAEGGTPAVARCCGRSRTSQKQRPPARTSHPVGAAQLCRRDGTLAATLRRFFSITRPPQLFCSATSDIPSLDHSGVRSVLEDTVANHRILMAAARTFVTLEGSASAQAMLRARSAMFRRRCAIHEAGRAIAIGGGGATVWIGVRVLGKGKFL